jgi:hypothetical protein
MAQRLITDREFLKTSHSEVQQHISELITQLQDNPGNGPQADRLMLSAPAVPAPLPPIPTSTRVSAAPRPAVVLPSRKGNTQFRTADGRPSDAEIDEMCAVLRNVPNEITVPVCGEIARRSSERQFFVTFQFCTHSDIWQSVDPSLRNS